MPESQIIIHVNRHVIDKNNKVCRKEPPIAVRRRSRKHPTQYTKTADLYVNDEKIGSLVYRPDKPLDCGAKVWLELDPTLVQVKVR